MKKQHIGHGGQPFDSAAEAKASFRFAELGCIPCKQTFPQIFKDSEGTEFQAKPDFYHPGSKLYIEFKCATLNGRKTKANADKQEADKLQFKGFLSDFDRINLQWNHAKQKHAIVQKTLTPQNFIVVFDKPPSWGDAYTYFKAGIVFCPMSALPTYLAKVRLAKAGLNLPFLLTYEVETLGEVALTLA